jgi:hypothetical protein
MMTVVMTISMKTVIMMLTLMLWALVPRALMPRALMEPEIHRVDPEFGSTLRLLKGFPVKLLGQLANFGSTL